MKVTLTTDLVVADDGTIDQDASTVAFRSSLQKRCAERETEQGQIAEVVSAIFDENLGASINMPALTGMAFSALHGVPNAHKTITERVANYVRENAQGKVVDGVAERPDSMLVISKGANGGVYRRADRAEKAAK